MRGKGAAAVLLLAVLLLGAPAWAGELPEVEAAAATLRLVRPPPRTAGAEMTVRDHRGRPRPAVNRTAGVPGVRVEVLFPPGSAELDDAQKLALHMLTRQWRDDPAILMLWLRSGGEPGLAGYSGGGGGGFGPLQAVGHFIGDPARYQGEVGAEPAQHQPRLGGHQLIQPGRVTHLNNGRIGSQDQPLERGGPVL